MLLHSLSFPGLQQAKSIHCSPRWNKLFSVLGKLIVLHYRSNAKYCHWFLADDLGEETTNSCHANSSLWGKGMTWHVHVSSCDYTKYTHNYNDVTMTEKVWGVLASERWWERPARSWANYNTHFSTTICWIFPQENDTHLCKCLHLQYFCVATQVSKIMLIFRRCS